MVSLSLEELFRIHLIGYQVFKRLLEQGVRFSKLFDLLLLDLMFFLELSELGLVLLDHFQAVGVILMDLRFRRYLPFDEVFLVIIHFKTLSADLLFNLFLQW